VATKGTAEFLRANDLPCDHVYKVLEGRPNAVDMMKNGEIHLVINTPLGKASYFDEKALRTTATQRGIPLITTISGGQAMVEAIRALRRGALTVKSLQEVYG
jgi:carbamoyl-phosphate synthase large subunit